MHTGICSHCSWEPRCKPLTGLSASGVQTKTTALYRNDVNCVAGEHTRLAPWKQQWGENVLPGEDVISCDPLWIRPIRGVSVTSSLSAWTAGRVQDSVLTQQVEPSDPTVGRWCLECLD